MPAPSRTRHRPRPHESSRPKTREIEVPYGGCHTDAQLILTHQLNRTTIPISDRPRLLYLLIETSSGQDRAARMPVHLALVVDKSDSMMIRVAPPDLQERWMKLGYVRENVIDGVPSLRVDVDKVSPAELRALPRATDMVKQALRAVVDLLGAGDRCALILFAVQAFSLVPLSSSLDREKILSAVETMDNLALGDDTYMGRGIALGLEELGRSTNHRVTSRMIVLTDGYTLDEADCRVLARRAKSMGIAISTMGVGGSYNEELIIPLADDTGGHAYGIEKLEDILPSFRHELSMVQSIVCRNLELKLRLSQGVELRAAHRVQPAISHLGDVALVDRSASLSLGDYETNAPPALLLELVCPPRSTAGTYRLAQLVLAYDEPTSLPGQAPRRLIRQDVVAHYVAGPIREPAHPRVMNIVERVTTFTLQTRALQDVQRGDISGATQRLRTAATRLLDMGETDLAQTVQEQARQLAERGQISSETAKSARYKTRRLTKTLR